MSEKVTFQELIDSIAEQTDNSKKFTHDFLKDFVSIINSGLEEDGKVNIAGFGKFELRRMDEREGYNPQTEEKITIPAHNRLVFKPYKDLRELVNIPYAHLDSRILEEHESEPEKKESDTEAGSDTSVSGLDEGLSEEEKNDEKEQGFIPTGPPPAVKSEKQQPSDSDEEEDEPPFELTESEKKKEVQEESGDVQQEPAEETDTDEEEKDDVIEYPSTPAEKQTGEVDESRLDEFLSEAASDKKQKSSEKRESADINEDLKPVEKETEPESEAGSVEDETDAPKDTGDFEKVEDSKVKPPPETSSEQDTESSPADTEKEKNEALYTQPPGRKQENGTSRIWIVTAVVLLILTVSAVLYFSSISETGQQPQQMTASTPQQEQTTAESQSEPQERSDAEQPGGQGSTPGGHQQQEPQVASQSQQQQQAEETTEETVEQGETLWGIAESRYQDPYLWPWIYDANKIAIDNPNLIVAGQSLSIPVPEEEDNGLSSSDSLEVAIGYIATYRWQKEQNNENAKYYLWAAKLYDEDIFDHVQQPIDEDDLAFANRVR